MDVPVSRDFLDQRVNLVLDVLVLLVQRVHQDLKVPLDLREIPVSLVTLVCQDGLELMEFQDSKVSLVHLVHLDLVALLDPPLLAEQAHRVSQDLKARWDHQGCQDQMAQKETLALQV